ncbi:MAG TPA: low affinity iron permease family protein [Pararhizobium sp.]|nr:low affinity iron permease family protein [Pararhizobium sp.]
MARWSAVADRATKESHLEKAFANVANAVAHLTRKPITFIICCGTIMVWAVSGFFTGFSDTWQLIVNTGTTIVTFLMVFLIQNTQNRDGAALQAKLDELIRVGKGQNRFIGIEHLPEGEVEEFRRRCEEAARVGGVHGGKSRRTHRSHAQPARKKVHGKADPPATVG